MICIIITHADLAIAIHVHTYVQGLWSAHQTTMVWLGLAWSGSGYLHSTTYSYLHHNIMTYTGPEIYLYIYYYV